MSIGLKATASSLIGLVYFGLLLFLPAGTFNYWQAWAFIAVFAVATAGPSIYLGCEETRKSCVGVCTQARPRKPGPRRRLSSLTYICGVAAMLVVSALDHRFGWSSVPTAVVLIGDVLVAVGLGIAMLVVIQNSYAAATITVEADQKLVSTGLYGLVRHPMYFGALIMMVGIPLALDSYWGLVFIIPGLVVLAFRILDEEKALKQELAGYTANTRSKCATRLVPYAW